MSDVAMRELHRRWERTRGRAEGLALLRARLRAGDLLPEQLELACHLGSPLACELLEREPPGKGLRATLRELQAGWGNEPLLRALVALAELLAAPAEREAARAARARAEAMLAPGAPEDAFEDLPADPPLAVLLIAEAARRFIDAGTRPLLPFRATTNVVRLALRRVGDAAAREHVGRSLADWALRSAARVAPASPLEDAAGAAAEEPAALSCAVRLRLLVEDGDELREVGATPSASPLVLSAPRWFARPVRFADLLDPGARAALAAAAPAGLHVGHKELTPAHLDAVAELPGVRWLSLRGLKELTPELAVSLARLTQLTHLDLTKVDLGRRELALLRRLTRLTSLDLHRGGGRAFMTAPPGALEGPAGLVHLTALPLRALSLRSEPLGEQELELLGRIGTLEDLNLRECLHGMRAGALAHLERLPRLRRLDLSRCVVSDARLPLVARLRGLRWLSLRNATGMTLPGLKVLSQLPALEVLEVPWDTPDHLRAIRRLLPRCQVE